jgi:hypothetical protein
MKGLLSSPAARGCFVGLALWILATAAFLAVRVRESPDYGEMFLRAFIGGAIAGFGLSLLVTVGQRLREWWWIRRAVRGERLRDGRRGAALGHVVLLGEQPATAPYSGRRCAIHEYTAYHLRPRVSGPSAEVKDYWGRHHVPCAVDGPQGRVQLFAWTEMDFPADEISASQALEKARAHIRDTIWTRTTPDLSDSKWELANQMFSSDGAGHWDFAAGDTDVGRLRFRESRVELDETVCALGRYSASRGGFVEDAGWIGFPIRIVKGQASTLAGERFRGAASLAVLSAALTALGAAFGLLL